MKKYTHYVQQDATGTKTTVPFTADDFAKMGLKFMSIGMPQIEAHEFVNELNKNQWFKFWL